MLLKRSGNVVSVYRADGTASETKYHKTSDTDKTYSKIGEELGFRSYANDNAEPGYGEVTGGRVDTDSPRIALMAETDAQEGDRIEFPDGKRYALDELIDRKAYSLFRSTLIT